MRGQTVLRTRPGFTLVETLIAMAFLAMATGLTLKMHQARLDFDRTAMQRLTDQLAVENVAEELSSVDDEQLKDAAARLAKESAVEIDVEPFDSESRTGWHIQIGIESETGSVVHHVWRVEEES